MPKVERVIVIEGSPRQLAKMLGLSRRQQKQLRQRPKIVQPVPKVRVLVLRGH